MDKLANQITLVFQAFIILSFFSFTIAVPYVSATGHAFVQDGYYSSSASPELSFLDEQQCRRMCAVSETCQSYVAFTSTVPSLATCYLYTNKVCVTDNSLLKLVPTAVTSRLYSKIQDGSLAPICNSSSQNGAASNQESATTVLEQPTTPSAIPTMSPLSTSATILNITTLNATVATTNFSYVLPEPRPRTCLDYFLNGTIDSSWTLRSVWLSGNSDGLRIDVYCKTGYTLILSNYAQISPSYSNRNEVTVFGSTTKRLSTNNPGAWLTYTSSINFPALSSLIADSGRILYYESSGDLKDEAAIYSGLTIATNGALTLAGSFQILKGSPPSAFTLPVTGNPFIPSTCGSFWVNPLQVGGTCDASTSNMLILGEFQRVGGSTRRLVALAFK